MQDPFSQLLGIFRADTAARQSPSVWLGQVKSKQPLEVETGGLTLPAAELRLAAGLGELEPGDQVVLLPLEEQQRFILLCKVV